MDYTPYILVLAGLYLVFCIRSNWLIWQAARYSLLATYYCFAKRLGVVVADEMSSTWPSNAMMLDAHRWDFDRYITRQDHLEDMKEFIAGELKREDLDVEEFYRIIYRIPKHIDPPDVPAAPADTKPTNRENE